MDFERFFKNKVEAKNIFIEFLDEFYGFKLGKVGISNLVIDTLLRGSKNNLVILPMSAPFLNHNGK
jgi:hypothetical protein